jgi:hypothetical protein
MLRGQRVGGCFLRQIIQGTDVQKDETDQEIPELNYALSNFRDKSGEARCTHLNISPFGAGVHRLLFAGPFWSTAILLESILQNVFSRLSSLECALGSEEHRLVGKT